MHKLCTNFGELSLILQPVSNYLDQCWWYIGGVGAHLDDRTAEDEYAEWIDDDLGFTVGKPGFFLRYIDNVNKVGSKYLACEGTDALIPSFALNYIDKYHFGFYQELVTATEWPLPDEILVVCCDFDCFAWDFFFREEYLISAVEKHLRRYPQMQCSRDFQWWPRLHRNS